MEIAPHPLLKAATVAVVGRTNSGKSTLVNRLVGEKVSIVSPVEQTTRNRIRGILTEARGQLVFLDTPGLHKAESELGTLMNRMARGAGEGSDLLLIIFDASSPVQMEDEGWMARAAFSETPTFFILNKSDAPSFNPMPFKAAWTRILTEKKSERKVPWLEISADQGNGCDALLEILFSYAIETPELLFPEEIVSDYPRKLSIADIIREKLIRHLFQEVPHELGVRVDTLIENPDNTWDIGVTLFVNRASQKGMVIGNKGRTLRAMRRSAEPEIMAAYDLAGCTITPFVRVEPKWFKNHFILKELGYKE
ncbi:MAG: GTPase Era [Kiritimatiellia bacterium]